MDLRALMGVLHKYWISLVICLLAGAALAVGYLQIAHPKYTASSQVFLSVQGGTTTSDLVQGANYSNTVAQSYAKLVTTPEVLGAVINNLSLNTTAEQLADEITTSIPTTTSLISISVVNGDPNLAASIAQNTASSLQATVKKLSPVDANQNSTIVATIVTPAIAPLKPTSPNVALTLALGIIIGLAVGIGQAVLRKTLDISIRSDSDVAHATDHSVLARIPFNADVPKDPLVIVNNPTSPVAEEYRRLRTNLGFVTLESAGSPVFVVTSSVEHEGKSVTSVNIAFSYAEAGQRVLLIDADLRRPRVASYLNLEGSQGLTTVLAGKAKMSEVIHKLGPGHLDVLPLGIVPPNPVEMAGSDAMRRLLTTAAQLYDIVIIDSAPLLPVTDTTLLASYASGTLIVAAAGKVHVPELHDAVATVEQGDATVLGIILTMVKRDPGSYYYRANYYGYGDSMPHKHHHSHTEDVARVLPAHADAPRRGA